MTGASIDPSRTRPAENASAVRRRRLPWRLKLVLSACGTALLLLTVEGVASLLLAVQNARHVVRMQEEKHARYDADLGWSNRAGIHLPDCYAPGVSFTTNRLGFRATEDYTAAIPPGKYRIVCLGDSFTMGYGVSDKETYPALLQAFHPSIQVVNMGQGGYGVDQDYLWYKRDGTPLTANMLVLAVVAHDVYRMAGNSFIGYAKPVLRASGDHLTVGNVPVPETWASRTLSRELATFVQTTALARLVYWAEHGVDPSKEAFYGAVDDRVFSALELALDDLGAVSRAKNQRFVIVYLPSSDLLPKEPTREALWLKDYSRRHSVAFINIADAMGKLPPWQLAPLFRPDYHYTAAGNKFVAESLLLHLRTLFPEIPN